MDHYWRSERPDVMCRSSWLRSVGDDGANRVGERASQRSCDCGFTLVEVLLASVLGAIVVATALIWLANTIRTSDTLTAVHDEDNELSLMLNLVMAELSEARPTALCLEPDPNTLTDPVIILSGSNSCTDIGENWGYWPTVSGGVTRVFRPGSPFYEATPDSICYYATPEGTVPDPATPAAPWGACIELSSNGQILARTLEPESDAKTSYIAAAIPSNYDWTSGTWTERILGTVDSIAFSYRGFDGTDLTPTPGNSVAGGSLADIANIEVTLMRRGGNVDNEVTDSVYVRASRFSPCRNVLTEYDSSSSTTTSTIASPACPTTPSP